MQCDELLSNSPDIFAVRRSGQRILQHFNMITLINFDCLLAGIPNSSSDYIPSSCSRCDYANFHPLIDHECTCMHGLKRPLRLEVPPQSMVHDELWILIVTEINNIGMCQVSKLKNVGHIIIAATEKVHFISKYASPPGYAPIINRIAEMGF